MEEAQQWHGRWRDGRIGFHRNDVSRALEQFWPKLKLAPGSSVFVPFCGKSLDLVWLREQQLKVTGVELSDIALESFLTENGIAARRVTGDSLSEYLAPGYRLLAGDLFSLTAPMLGECSGIYDRASLVALPPRLQGHYAAKIAALTSPGTQTLLVTLEYPQHEMSGPPFSTDRPAVERLYSGHHRVELLDRADVWASDPLRERGITALHEACYRLTRL